MLTLAALNSEHCRPFFACQRIRGGRLLGYWRGNLLHQRGAGVGKLADNNSTYMDNPIDFEETFDYALRVFLVESPT